MASIWIVSEDSVLAGTLAFHLNALGEVASGEPERGPWKDEARAPDLLVLIGADEPSGELGGLERLLEFVRRVEPYRRSPPPVLYIEPAGGHPPASLAAALIDDRPTRTIELPLDPAELVEAAAALLDRLALPASLRERARRDWVNDRVARYYAGLDLPALRHAIDPRNASRPVLLCGEPGTGPGLVARYIHSMAEPVREGLVMIPASELAAGEVEARVLARIAGRRVTAYLENLSSVEPGAQEELGHLLGQSGLLGVEPVRWIASSERPRRLSRSLRDLPWMRVELPPLRSRPDLATLIQEWIGAWCERTGRRVEVDEAALEVLLHYGWPGNLAELDSVLTASLARLRADRLGVDALAIGSAPAPGAAEPAEPEPDAVEPSGEADTAEPTVESEAPEEPEPGVRFENGEPIELTEADVEEPAEEPELAERADEAPPALRSPELRELLAPLTLEVREPLLAIRTYANLLEQRPNDESVRRELTSLVEGDLGRIEETLHRLERFAGFGEPQAQEVDLGQVVSSEIERRRAVMRQRSLVILEELERDAPPARADEEQLRFALGALLDRALRMVPTGGDLYVGSLHRAAEANGGARHRVLIRFHSPEDVLVTPEGVPGPPMPLEVVVAKSLIARMGGAFAVDASGAQDNLILLELPA
jgi:DNA-binding NtrC family response regulator